MEDIIVIGGGGHAVSVMDSITSMGAYNIVGYTDRKPGCQLGIPYLGTDDVLEKYHTMGIKNAVLGIGFMGGKSTLRETLYKTAKQTGYTFPVIIDSSAIVSSRACIGEGTFIGKKAVVNAAAKIGVCCIVNTGAIIEHEDKVESFSHIAVGTILCGNVYVGAHCFIGAGSTVIQNIAIGENTIVGAGSIVIRNVESNSKVCGLCSSGG